MSNKKCVSITFIFVSFIQLINESPCGCLPTKIKLKILSVIEIIIVYYVHLILQETTYFQFKRILCKMVVYASEASFHFQDFVA